MQRTSSSPTEIEPTCNFAGGFWVAVEIVCIEGDCGDHDSKHVKAPEQARHHVVICVFERESQPDQASQHERCAHKDGPQPHLRLEFPSVALDVLIRNEVVQPMTSDLTKQRRDDRREVEVADRGWTELVERSQEY